MGRRSPAELYLWTWGAALVFLGVGSLVVHPDFAVGDRVTGARFLGVETNGWHGVAGLASGLCRRQTHRSIASPGLWGKNFAVNPTAIAVKAPLISKLGRRAGSTRGSSRVPS